MSIIAHRERFWHSTLSKGITDNAVVTRAVSKRHKQDLLLERIENIHLLDITIQRQDEGMMQTPLPKDVIVMSPITSYSSIVAIPHMMLVLPTYWQRWLFLFATSSSWSLAYGIALRKPKAVISERNRMVSGNFTRKIRHCSGTLQPRSSFCEADSSTSETQTWGVNYRPRFHLCGSSGEGENTSSYPIPVLLV